MNAGYRGRFAPSPSGSLHFGSLVAAMGSYLDARSNNGTWLVRMEDLDRPREKKGAADDIIRTLNALGFEWDGEIVRQSERTEAYRAAAASLAAAGVTYACACTRKEVSAAARSGPEGPIYPGTCRNGLQDGRAARSTRVRTTAMQIGFLDLVCGDTRQVLLNHCGDFIIRRADGLFAYQLAVVVDDIWQGITRVVRGADLLVSTPRQIYLQQLLGFPSPEYAHLPLVLDHRGRKLSKQSRSRPVRSADPLSSLMQAWKFLNQASPEGQPSTVGEFWEWALSRWQLKRVPCRTSGR